MLGTAAASAASPAPKQFGTNWRWRDGSEAIPALLSSGVRSPLASPGQLGRLSGRGQRQCCLALIWGFRGCNYPAVKGPPGPHLAVLQGPQGHTQQCLGNSRPAVMLLGDLVAPKSSFRSGACSLLFYFPFGLSMDHRGLRAITALE